MMDGGGKEKDHMLHGALESDGWIQATFLLVKKRVEGPIWSHQKLC